MPDSAIAAFFAERKEEWLKKNIKTSMTEEEQAEKEIECEGKFSTNVWLPDAAKRAGQMSMATHPCTFSHPSARKNKNGYVSAVIAQTKKANDGYLRTGNAEGLTDALGNAAALDVYKFLSLTLEDGKTLLTHIQQSTDAAKALLTIDSVSYDELRAGFMAIAETENSAVTSSKIKQVYFPVDNAYHLLSTLTNSGLVFELKRRLDDMRFSEKVKALRKLKKEDAYSDEGFSEIYKLTTIGYGGTNPRNISALNNSQRGKAHLLLCAPPALEKRDIRFPGKNFFSDSIRYYEGLHTFRKLDKLFKTRKDSVIPLQHQKSGIEKYLGELLDLVISRMWAVRGVCARQYIKDTNQLSKSQAIWLCDENHDLRVNSDDWLEDIYSAMTEWVIQGYSHNKINDKPMPLGTEERKAIREFIKIHKEALR